MTTSLTTATEAPTTTGFAALNLSEPVLRAIEEIGYTEPTPVQAATYPIAITGRDIIVQARTGTGKTAAFGIPLVDKIVNREPWVQALVLAPTRELAVQSQRELARLAQYKDLHPVAIYGGAPMGRQIDELKSGAQIVSGTPGRVLDHLRRGTFDPSHLKVLVLDEMDEMLSMGFAKELNAILELIPPRGRRQTMCFSATVDGEVRRHAERHMHEPEMISLSSDGAAASSISHHVYMVSGRDRIGDLVRVLEVEDPESAIIFCNMRSETERVAMGLKQAGFNADWLNGDLPQRDRERIMASTREGKLRYLVATDVAARGIDISHLTHVINFTFPESAAVYVHRTGRTGRAGRTGCAISLVGPEELGRLYYLRLEYKIAPIERSLPTSGELKTRQEIDRIGLLEAAFTDRANPNDIAVAKRLLTHPENERILAGLLHTFFGTKDDVDEEAAAARRSKLGPDLDESARVARERERPRDRDRGRDVRGRDRDRRDRDRDEGRGREQIARDRESGRDSRQGSIRPGERGRSAGRPRETPEFEGEYGAGDRDPARGTYAPTEGFDEQQGALKLDANENASESRGGRDSSPRDRDARRGGRDRDRDAPRGDRGGRDRDRGGRDRDQSAAAREDRDNGRGRAADGGSEARRERGAEGSGEARRERGGAEGERSASGAGREARRERGGAEGEEPRRERSGAEGERSASGAGREARRERGGAEGEESRRERGGAEGERSASAGRESRRERGAEGGGEARRERGGARGERSASGEERDRGTEGERTASSESGRDRDRGGPERSRDRDRPRNGRSDINGIGSTGAENTDGALLTAVDSAEESDRSQGRSRRPATEQDAAADGGETAAADAESSDSSDETGAAKRSRRRRRGRDRKTSDVAPLAAAGEGDSAPAPKRSRRAESATPLAAVDGELFPMEAEPSEPTEPLEGLLYLNLGKRDGLRAPEVVHLLRDSCALTPGQIGRVRVRDRYTFVDVPEGRLDGIIETLSGQKVHDRPLAPERAKTAKT